MLSAKRSGSTAIYKMFQNHPDVGVCHHNQEEPNWEPQFWSLGAKAVKGAPEEFISRFKQSHPFLKLPDTFNEQSLFKLWDDILDKLGPVIFDKSPQYLGDEDAMELLRKYMKQGNDVRIFAFIRDPRDTVASQHSLWGGDPKTRELAWLKQYKHLEELQKNLARIPLFKYEDFAHKPSYYAPILFKHCGCRDIPKTYKHIKPTSIGRYSTSGQEIKDWKFSEELKLYLKKYGYTSLPTLSKKESLWIRLRNIRGKLKRLVKKKGVV